MLADTLHGLPSRPHETSNLAAKGRKQYAYYTKALAQITRERTGKIEYMAEAKVDSGNKFDSLTENFVNNMNCTGTRNKPNPLLATPNQ